MSDATELRKQQYQRMIELSNIAQQRRSQLASQGDTRRRSGRKGDDYLTEEEREEFFALGRQLSGLYVKDGYVHCQGKSWKLPENSTLLPNQIASEVNRDS